MSPDCPEDTAALYLLIGLACGGSPAARPPASDKAGMLACVPRYLRERFGLKLSLAGLGDYMPHNTLQTNATQMAPEVRGTAVSLFASAFFIGQSLGVVLPAALIERAGSFMLFLVAMLAMPAIAALFAGLLWRRRQLAASGR